MDAVTIALAALGLWAAQDAPAPAQDLPPEVKEGDYPDLVVSGTGKTFPHCTRRSGDPQDSYKLPVGDNLQRTLREFAPGKYRVEGETNPITGPLVWQRAGTGMGSFVYRAPPDDSLLCIGSKSAPGNSWGQLRRILDGSTIRGKYVRMTAFVAARRGSDARAWLAAGNNHKIIIGDMQSRPVRITGDWEPLSITMGPVPIGAFKVSYGFLLKGDGDVWISQLKVEILDKRPEDTFRRKGT